MIYLSFLRTTSLNLSGTFGNSSENSFVESEKFHMNLLIIIYYQNLTDGFWPVIQTESIWMTSSTNMETIGISISNKNRDASYRGSVLIRNGSYLLR
jgi:hypothetical protein